MTFVRVRDIVAVHAAGDNAVLHLADVMQARVRKPLREWVDWQGARRKLHSYLILTASCSASATPRMR